ncbi:flagellar basal body protein FliL [Methylovirgula ligni]|uniref:Flagellar protein FliL n=1 Tax=Methylovirgula ligni TaxID=569860 RepID=A0A3D9YVA4_9HYPH|nr:flagellar basal body-associated FliL family protein [Methylovirgula ligni]QAY96194.1 flagellar basal body protein FliL [Methylovirgula ligni]REF86108.1 flagellar FliL protein [Methylovirgula ligni]
MAEADEFGGEASAAIKLQTFPALIPWLATMAGLSLFAILVGGMLGFVMVSTVRSSARNAADPAVAPATKLIDLPPIVTNLADPSNTWVRLQTAIVVDANPDVKPDVLAAEISDDLLGFMKTESLAQIGGASGLQHLREDLTERAVIRSQGHVRELIIQTLVVQ